MGPRRRQLRCCSAAISIRSCSTTFPAVWWFTGFHPDYHQISDTVEKINFEKMAKILKLAYTSGFEFADSPNVPKLVGKAMSRQ